MEPKRGRSSGVEPSWDISRIRSWQTDKSQTQPPSEPEPQEPSPKLKSIVKSVRLSLPKPEDLESLGPAARSRYDEEPKEDQPRWDRSRHHAHASVHPKDSHRSKSRSGTADKSSEHSNRGSSRHGRKSGQSPSQKPKKEESLGAKLLARKEWEKWFKKIVENLVLYMEECSNQILLEEHQLEIEAMWFFGPGAERAVIDILAIIDWAAEYVAISNHPFPDILSFLRTLFVMGKAVVHPILYITLYLGRRLGCILEMKTEPSSRQSPAHQRTYKTIWRQQSKKDGKNILRRASRKARTSASPHHLGPAHRPDSTTRSDSRSPGTRPRLKAFLPDSPSTTQEEQEAINRYQTPAEEDASHGTKMQLTIDEELVAEDVTTIGDN